MKLWVKKDVRLLTISHHAWKREHVKLQLPKIHHGRGNTKNIIASHLTGRRRKDDVFSNGMAAVEKEIEKSCQQKK
jgi:hypothetical protein